MIVYILAAIAATVGLGAVYAGITKPYRDQVEVLNHTVEKYQASARISERITSSDQKRMENDQIELAKLREEIKVAPIADDCVLNDATKRRLLNIAKKRR